MKLLIYLTIWQVLLVMVYSMIVSDLENTHGLNGKKQRLLLGLNDISAVLLVAQKTNCSRMCFGVIVSRNSILTTATCVENSINVIVRHNYNQDGQFNTLISDTVINVNPDYVQAGTITNLAIVVMQKGLDQTMYDSRKNFRLPDSVDDHPFYTLTKDNTYSSEIYMGYGALFSTDYTKYPSIGVSLNFAMTKPSVCQQQITKDRGIILKGERPTGEYCLFSTNEFNTFCKEDEGAPIFETRVKDAVTMETELVLIGLVNLNNRECLKFKNGEKIANTSRYTYISPIAGQLPWIYKNLAILDSFKN